MKTRGKFVVCVFLLCVALVLLLAVVRSGARNLAGAQNAPELLPPPRDLTKAAEDGRKFFFERGKASKNPNPDPKDTCCNCCSCHIQHPQLLAKDLTAKKFTDDQLFNAIKKGVCEVDCTQVPNPVPETAILYKEGNRAFVYCKDINKAMRAKLPFMGTHMRSFAGDLTDDEIRDIVAYLRTRTEKDLIPCRDFKPGK